MDLAEIKRKGENGAAFQTADVFWLIAEVERLTCELETERIRLAGCGVAAMCNTEQSRREQSISKGSPYYSASYQDVLDAVAREIKLRAERDMLRATLIATGRNLGAVLTNDVTNDFLSLVPLEALIVYKKAARASHER